jgi:hypothetical protein
MADDEVEILYSHLLRAKTAIEPLAHVKEIWPYRNFFETASGPFIDGLRACYLERPGATAQLVGAVLPHVATLVNSIQYAAMGNDFGWISEQSKVLRTTLQGLPGGDSVLPKEPQKQDPPSNPPPPKPTGEVPPAKAR